MPANTPKRGYPYPLPDDAIADYPTLGQSLAEQLDAELVLPPGNAPGDVLTWTGSMWAPVAGVATVSAPSVTVAPSLVGAVNAGATVTRGPATWAGNPVPTVVWEWWLNRSGWAKVQDGGDTYAIPSDAAGTTLLLREIATNSIGSSQVDVTGNVNVGIAGGWRAQRPFADISHGDLQPLRYFTGNPVGNGALTRDDWGAGAVDTPNTPSPGTYRVTAHIEFPNDWNQGYSGDGWADWEARAGAVVQGHANAAGTGTLVADIDQTFTGVPAGVPIGIWWSGGGTGKSARPNNFWCEVVHLG